MDLKNRASSELRFAGDIKQVHKARRSVSRTNEDLDHSGLKNCGSDFKTSERKLQSRFVKSNPQIIVSGSSLLQEFSKKDVDNHQDSGNLKISCTKVRFQDTRKKLSPFRFNDNITNFNLKKDSSPLSRSSENSTREVKQKLSPKLDQTQHNCVMFNKITKYSPKVQTGLCDKEQISFPYPDPISGAGVKFMQRISEISTLEAETLKWEQGVARWRRKN